MLGSRLVRKGVLRSVTTRDISVEEAKCAAEMMFVSSLIPIKPIVNWDGEPIGDGEIGEVTQQISDLFWEDIVSGSEKMRTQVPY
ncbi:hypothetical protein HPP92_003880 [Vanilla planifolia]|nr:hypothetical protein HPP92_003880 [Vanilla planifolia]